MFGCFTNISFAVLRPLFGFAVSDYRVENLLTYRQKLEGMPYRKHVMNVILDYNVILLFH